MFSVVTKLDKLDNRVLFQCPKCGTKSIYFRISPDECDYCKEPLPDGDKMKKSMRARYNYHIYSKD